METFLQTFGHQQFDTLESFTAFLTTFQALSDRECYLYRKTVARIVEKPTVCTPVVAVQMWQSKLPSQIFY